ncbi:GDSL esterase/lipase At5g03980-like isoform X2 [Nicotiana sylvestris]|uniref:GDSL esterase/lipase At5g03980-like isoform X2 n=1 Tax=Nicotiana sylvestris TaxID=4096 RepID=A0A1U7VVE8_NICSY|nr:PREDICTED: GDSL esterase/lipase At5g03980-like isoform X2 [Nicotiana sylvestris]
MALIIRSLLDFLVISSISLVVLQQKSNGEDQLLMLQKPRLMKCRFDKIFQLGDSLSDTGNCIRENLCARGFLCGRFPYGMNFFQNTTGRCSNGMLMIDFIVAGATALSTENLAEEKIVNSVTNSSLSVQLDWMSTHFKSTYPTDRLSKLKKSLFLVGEIGGNEFNYGLFKGKTLKELRSMVPKVVQTIIQGVRTVISFGATRIIVPGNFPIGCLPIFLTQFRTSDSTAYDEYHCLQDLNDLAIFFNDHLKQAIQELKEEHSNIALVYGDYYNAYMWLLQNAMFLGFDKNSLLKACCGIGGDYNYDVHNQCGAIGVSVCTDPSTYISWDGVHLTEKTYSWLARWLIDDMLPKLNCHV